MSDAVAISETSRESFSSHGSWIKRLSLRPTSQHGSPRSSVGPDSAFSFSQGSGAPILSPTGSAAPQMPPNKLVKRSGNESIFVRRGTRQVPTLRRPVTSHQRSATAQQLSPSPTAHLVPDKATLGQRSRPRASTAGQINSLWRKRDSFSWTSFFHARRGRASKRGHVVTPSNESNSLDFPLPGKRIHMRRGSLSIPYLINPQMISGEVPKMAMAEELEPATSTGAGTESSNQNPPYPQDPQDLQETEGKVDPPEKTRTTRTRRSFSVHIDSSGGWVGRAGSQRRSSRDSAEFSGCRRYASDPVSTSSPNAAQSSGAKLDIEELFTPPQSGHREPQTVATFAVQGRKRDCSSPVPPLARLSTLHFDTSKLDPSPPPSAGFQASSPTQACPTAAPHGAPMASHSRAVSKEGASTLAGSEMSVPGLASCDDDDTDYKSDAVFDSFRTTDSDRVRMVETPLDSMFDESLHGTAGNVKTRRLSIQEMLGQSWDGDTRIMEEDEGSSTPNRGITSSYMQDGINSDEDRATEIAKFQISIGNNRSFGRISLDTTDDDFDWARDDEDVLSNPLSPPTSSINSRRGQSPLLRPALTNISGNGTPDANTGSDNDRPRSNIFDWSEPSHDKGDEEPSRPKTVHGKQELALRGSRQPIRRGFQPAHVRSQSMPNAADPIDIVKGVPKFGTWGISTKNASEDWDDDFEFEEGSNSGSGPRSPTKPLSMSVPKSIQTTQATVKAHSGQIRELSLLVSSLKRLCRQGRALNLQHGQSATLWTEAENIIALASPDDDEVEENNTDRSSSDFDPAMIDERFLEEGFDAEMLDRPEDETPEPDIPKNSVVRERQVPRRRSVFSPDDDIFGNNPSVEKEGTRPHTPKTPERVREFHTPDGAVVSSVIAAMEQQRSKPGRQQESPLKPSKAKLFFDTNSLQELVKRAGTVFHALSDIVRREELLTMSPQVTPRHERRRGGSPAFTRVFTDPESSPPRPPVRSQKSHSPIPRKTPDPNGLGQRMQMMTVS